MSDISTDTALLREIGAEIRLLNDRLNTLESLVAGIGHDVVTVRADAAGMAERVRQITAGWMILVAVAATFAAAYVLLHLPGLS